MEDPKMPGGVPPEPPYSTTTPPYSTEGTPPYTTPPAGYTQVPYGTQQGPYVPPTSLPPAEGLSDTAAGALAYVTIIPAIIFLIIPPYNMRPFVKFHSLQCIGLAVLGLLLGVLERIPFFGWIVWSLGGILLFVLWIMCIVKASQGGYLRLPVISEFAAKQSGYVPGRL